MKKMFNNKKGMDFKEIVLAALAIIFLFFAISFAKERYDDFKKTSDAVSHCSGMGIVNGECTTSSECTGLAIEGLGCPPENKPDLKYCCATEGTSGSGSGGESAVNGYVAPASTNEELRWCKPSDEKCEEQCKLSVKDVSVSGRGDDGKTAIGDNERVYVTVTLDKIYSQVTDCITKESISAGIVDKSGTMHYYQYYSCMPEEGKQNWVRFKCIIYNRNENKMLAIEQYKSNRFEFRLKPSDSCKCIKSGDVKYADFLAVWA
jgi:hypothetical protein